MQLLAKGNPNWPQAFYKMKVNIGLYSKCYVSFEYFVVINCIHTLAHTRQHDLRNLNLLKLEYWLVFLEYARHSSILILGLP